MHLVLSVVSKDPQLGEGVTQDDPPTWGTKAPVHAVQTVLLVHVVQEVMAVGQSAQRFELT